MLAVGRTAPVVIGAQILLTLLVVAVSIPVMRRPHDAVPSSVRAGVASGVGTLTWLTFVPFALILGFVADRIGVSNAGWLLVVVAVAAGVLILLILAAVEPGPALPADRFLPGRRSPVARPLGGSAAGRLSTEDIANLDPYVRDRLHATLIIPRRR